jgi:HEAT repeat protein
VLFRSPGHEAARDHSLAPPVAGPGEIPAACVGCHADGTSAKKVTAAWQGPSRARSVQRRLEIIDAIDASTKGSPDAAAALARVVGDADRGWFLRWAALERLQAGRSGPASEDVLGPVRRALSDPNPALRRAAAGALGNCGATKDIEALQRASDDADPWEALEAAHSMGRLGAVTAGARLLQLLTRPDLIADARAQYLYGHACLLGQDAPRAEVSLRRALELNPMMVGAINDLGLALMGQHEPEQAKAAWKRALDINPRFTAAQRNLETAKP